MDGHGLNRESFLFALTSNVPHRIKLCSSLVELLPTQAVKNYKETVQCSWTSPETCGGNNLRHLQGFTSETLLSSCLY